MADIRHRVGIRAPIAEVYGALATRDGIAGWWTEDVQGDSEIGVRLAFGFGGPEPAVGMRVDELAPLERVRWTCVEGPDEWRDTTLVFDLAEGNHEAKADDGPGGNGEVRLLFTHGGWREPVEFMHHCSTKWAQFLLGLKAGLEGGRAAPWPGDQAISSWG